MYHIKWPGERGRHGDEMKLLSEELIVDVIDAMPTKIKLDDCTSPSHLTRNRC